MNKYFIIWKQNKTKHLNKIKNDIIIIIINFKTNKKIKI